MGRQHRLWAKEVEMHAKTSPCRLALVLFLLLAAACGPATTPAVFPPTAVPPPTASSLPTIPPTLQPTGQPTTAPSSPPDPRAAIEADLWSYTRVRAEAEKTLDPELLRQVCVDPYLTQKMEKIDQNRQAGVHWETREMTLTITSIEVETAGQANVKVSKTETKLFYPAGSTLPDDEACGTTIYSYRDCTYEVLYTMVWQDGHWYVSDAVDSGECRGMCRQIPKPTTGPSLEVSFEGITFSYDAGLASEVVPEIVPGDDPTGGPDWWKTPQHYRFSFQGYTPSTAGPAELLVLSVAEYEALNEVARSNIAEMRQLLADRPAAECTPVLPVANANRFICVQPAYLDFQNGAGVRFLASYGQDYVSIPDTLTYFFQGLTDDGRYYVSAILPVTPPPLAACEDLPCDNWPALLEKYDLYIQGASQQLAGEDASRFTPDLARLDALIQSLAVTAPQPTATTPLEGLVILYFRANVEEADPGDTITLEWATTGGSEAILYALLPGGYLSPNGQEVALTGTWTHTIPLDARNSSMFELFVSDQAGQWHSAQLTIKLRCPVAWFFSPAPDICGTEPIFSQAAEQHFEHGVMIWIEELDKIVILYDEFSPQYHGKWSMLDDEWEEGDPEYDPALTPPAGLYQPVRGFGLVWREHEGARDRLGWAVDQEMAFDTVIQTSTEYKYDSTYIRALDGNVWRLWPEVSGWEKIQVSAP